MTHVQKLPRRSVLVRCFGTRAGISVPRSLQIRGSEPRSKRPDPHLERCAHFWNCPVAQHCPETIRPLLPLIRLQVDSSCKVFAAYWFLSALRRSNLPPLGAIFFWANVFAGISALLATRLAARIGLVRTMVVTHLPSNILLILVPLMPNLPLAVLMLSSPL